MSLLLNHTGELRLGTIGNIIGVKFCIIFRIRRVSIFFSITVQRSLASGHDQAQRVAVHVHFLRCLIQCIQHDRSLCLQSLVFCTDQTDTAGRFHHIQIFAVCFDYICFIHACFLQIRLRIRKSRSRICLRAFHIHGRHRRIFHHIVVCRTSCQLCCLIPAISAFCFFQGIKNLLITLCTGKNIITGFNIR